MRLRLRRLWPSILASVLVLAGCTSMSTMPDDDPNAQSARVENYRIGPADMVQVDVWRNPDVSVTTPVRPDGMISVPLVGDVRAGGRTPEELAEVVEQALGYYIRDTEVTVIVTELNSHEYLYRVRVTGAVETPLSMAFRPGMTVLDLVLEAGGMTEFASPNRSRLYRSDGKERRTYPVRLDDILADGDLTTNYTLRPGDIVAVPERLF
ncbi:XrtA/PEP-CTERM system exopolysaccharide export protein [Halofilum ochraceum]|uniref:XrtA/PEP-CTERM system exopolysaccharide export protein n=1 Tax=Halofilum ochraceum TaxID=1611323 RepID=UPI0008DA5CAE|nr:XrtA/PEP-CTERM system exopolysaccharide export protein [Halofilum ochraceum]